MTLHVHRAERADRLADELAELMAEPLPDVFAEEVIAVPARGIERWLTQRLSHRLGRRTGRADGICAGVRFPSPAALIAEVAGGRDDDPWAPDAAVWPLIEVIDAAAGEAWARTLAVHLGLAAADTGGAVDPDRRGRRYAVARRIAGLFDGYATHRPEVIAAWSAGADTDGWGEPLPPDLAWQPELWRRLAARIAAGGPVDPARRLAEVTRRLRDMPQSVDLPARLSLFGPTALPQRSFRVLDALSERRDVHVWLPHPSPALWAGLDAEGGSTGPVRRRADPSVRAVRHPLLSSLGRDSRELHAVLAPAAGTDTHHPAAPGAPRTLLEALQHDIAANRPPGGAYPADPADRSISVHACHGAARQVDVLRDVLAGLLADDETLQPSDILVMCPDIESYAPLIQAAFGLGDLVEKGHPAHRLRVRLADRALLQTNPLLGTLARLLELADGRVTASDVVDLAAWAPVRRRFGFTDDEIERISSWAAESGARWGLDAQHRKPFGLDRFGQNTWRAGLDRVLLGVAMAEEDDSWLGTALPLDDVGSSDVDLVGRLAELLARLQTAVDALHGNRPIGEWVAALVDIVDGITATAAGDSWQRAELRRELAGLAEHAARNRATASLLDRRDLRAMLAGRFAGRPTRANFRTGTVTICTMVPMRSVPHRVVCLLGIDDGVFPRVTQEDGDNLLHRDPAVGERDPRSEDRQLLLDAVMAARERLVVTYTGADERTGARRPPAVPLGELLDTLDDTAARPDGSPVSARLVVRHPLQPYDSRTVEYGALGRPGPFTFDPAALGGARAAVAPRVPPAPLVPEPLPPAVPQTVDLAELTGLLVHPARGFLRQRLDVAVRFEEAEPSDAVPVQLDGLQRYQIGERLLRSQLSGTDAKAGAAAEWRRGTLPPGRLGDQVLDDLLVEIAPLVEKTASLRAEPARVIDVDVDLGGGRRVRGTVGGVHGSCLVTVSFASLSARSRLRAWVALLALTASEPDSAWGAATVGRRGKRGAGCVTIQPVDAALARDCIAELVDLYDRGLRAPLPIPIKSAATYAASRHGGELPADAELAAAREWRTTRDAPVPGEDTDNANVQVWGIGAPFGALLHEQAGEDERWSGGEEPHRFGELTMRLWSPLLDREQSGAL